MCAEEGLKLLMVKIEDAQLYERKSSLNEIFDFNIASYDCVWQSLCMRIT